MIQYLFPQGRKQVLTFSYDDGNDCDRRLADIFTENGLKATFNLNAGFMKSEGKIHAEELKNLFLDHGHEVACHGFVHPFEDLIPTASVIEDIRRDRLELERATGAPVRGMAYPMGTYNEEVKKILRMLGIAYCRTVKSQHRQTYFPEDFLEWHPTLHHTEDLEGAAKTFLNPPGWNPISMLYVWGHAYEFDGSNNWDVIENFCKKMAHLEQVWYATNIEIYDYLTACRRLTFSMDQHLVSNPSAMAVWLNDAGKAVEIPGGATVELSGD